MAGSEIARKTGVRGQVGRATEERILEAALRLFAKRGFGAAGIREIASGAGVTTATLYHHAASKEEILLKLMERGMGRLLGAAGEVLPLLEAPEQKLVALVRLHVMIHGVHQLSAIVNDAELRALGEENRVAVVEKRDAYEAYWRQTLSEGVSRGIFDVEDAKLATFGLLEMCTGVARWYSSEGELSIAEISVRFANMALALVGASREGKRLLAEDVSLPEGVEERLVGVGATKRV